MVIYLDTETTGLFPEKGDRIVQISMINGDVAFNSYLNPDRDSDPEAFKVHGLTRDFLSANGFNFAEIAPYLLQFIGSETIVAHNANFDLKFVNSELQRIGMRPLTNKVIDTLALAKQRLPLERYDLDTLARYVGLIERSGKHDAVHDCSLLREIHQFLSDLPMCSPNQ